MCALTTTPTPVVSSDTRDSWQPVARHDHMVVTEVNGEILVYDQTSHGIHHLNSTSQAIWTLCDGTRTMSDIAQAAGVTLGAEVSEDVVRLALGQLEDAKLLAGAIPVAIGQPVHSRRTMRRRMVVAGGVALPALASISAPVAANQVSSCGEGLTYCPLDGKCFNAIADGCCTDGDCFGSICYGGSCRDGWDTCTTAQDCYAGLECRGGICYDPLRNWPPL